MTAEFFSVLILLTYISRSAAWDLSPIGLELGLVTHVRLCGLRVFLSVERREASHQFSLVETTWPEMPRRLLSIIKPFPNRTPQVLGNCSMVQTAVSSDWDSFHHLFVLDAGWLHFCPPKIHVYDLFTNKLVISKEIPNVSGKALKHFIVDTEGSHGPRAYISDPSSCSLTVFDLHTQGLWTVPLSLPVELYDDHRHSLSQFQLDLTGFTLYMNSHHSDLLFKTDVSVLRTLPAPSVDDKVDALSVIKVGSLLGPAEGMVADKLVLYYCLARDFACVRWNTTLPLVAENHQVLLQSAERIPHVKQLFLDFQRQPWALTQFNHSSGTHCVRINGQTPFTFT